MNDVVVDKGGRPSGYNEDTQAKAEAYLYEYDTVGDVIPSNAGLACWLGISRETVYDWGRKYPQFSDTLAAIQVKQENIALNRGLTGVFNSTITKLVLANHGYSDSQKIDHSSKDGSMATKTLDDFYKGVDSEEKEEEK